MSEATDDLFKPAEIAAALVDAWRKEFHIMSATRDTDVALGELTRRVGTALSLRPAADRGVVEECARVAENWHPMLYAPELDGRHPRDAAYRDARTSIAAAIRALAPGQAGGSK